MKLILKLVILLATLVLEHQANELNGLRFKNIKCEFSAEYSNYSYCGITFNKDRQAVIAGGVYLIKKLPTIMNQVQLFKWANGYKPGFLKTTVDICRYLNGEGGMVSKLTRQLSEPFITKSYSCPILPDWYNTSFTLTDLRVVEAMVPFGNYQCSMKFYDETLTIKYGAIDIFVDIYEKFKPTIPPVTLL